MIMMFLDIGYPTKLQNIEWGVGQYGFKIFRLLSWVFRVLWNTSLYYNQAIKT